MKQVLWAVSLLMLLSAHKCNEKTAEAAGGGDAVTGASKIPALLNGKWMLQTVKGNTFTMPDGMEGPWLQLVKDGSRIEGHGGCNALMGQFTLDGDQIGFPGLGSTKKYCESVQSLENAYMGALRNTHQFKVDDGVLHLMDDVGANLATFTQQ